MIPPTFGHSLRPSTLMGKYGACFAYVSLSVVAFCSSHHPVPSTAIVCSPDQAFLAKHNLSRIYPIFPHIKRPLFLPFRNIHTLLPALPTRGHARPFSPPPFHLQHSSMHAIVSKLHTFVLFFRMYSSVGHVDTVASLAPSGEG